MSGYVGFMFIDGEPVPFPDCGAHDTYDVVVAADDTMIEALRSANRTVKALSKVVLAGHEEGALPL